jgi:hypothetical protein
MSAEVSPMNSHALALVDQLIAQCALQAATQSPHWLQAIQATGGIATTVGVLTALYIAAIREPRKDAVERREHLAQVSAVSHDPDHDEDYRGQP